MKQLGLFVFSTMISSCLYAHPGHEHGSGLDTLTHHLSQPATLLLFGVLVVGFWWFRK